jgi:peptidylprolyl isomerase
MRLLFASALALVVLTACGGVEASNETPASIKEDGLYVVFDTSMGEIVCKLHYDKAPLTVANFVGLVKGEKEFTDPKTGETAKRPFYDGLKFHRIIKDFMIQGGCPLGTGTGGPGYSFMDEFDASLRHDKPGVLSMANSGPATNGSQFFITHVPTPWLDDKHTVFGECVSGQEIVDAMAEVAMSDGSTPVEDIMLNKASIRAEGDAAKAFDWAATWGTYADKEAAAAAERDAAAAVQLVGLGDSIDCDFSKKINLQPGLDYVVRQAGTGEKPTQGQTISAHYTGYLLDGTKFDSSVDRGQPFETPIGVGRVISGWDVAFQDMQVGEKRVLIIGPDMGYGARGAGGVIPPNATLVFDVELLGIK